MATPRLIDSHTHVQFPAYGKDRGAVISRALDAGIWMVNIGTEASTSRLALELAEEYPEGVYASVGFHPGHVDAGHHDAWEKTEPAEEFFDVGVLRGLAAHPKAVGIGECGLDYYRLGEKDEEASRVIKEKQKEIFAAQIELAKALQKPLIIHCREAFDDLIEILSPVAHDLPLRPGAIHFFSGTVEKAKTLMDLGFYLGFGGVVTFAKTYEAVVGALPLEQILLETDAPYVAPVPHRGRRNEPLYIEAVAEKIAEWKGVAAAEVMEKTAENTRSLFGI